MKKNKKAILSMMTVSLLLIGLSTSLSSFSGAFTTIAAATNTTTGTNDVVNGTLVSGIPCSYEVPDFAPVTGNLLGYWVYTGFGTSCALGGNQCKTDDYQSVQNCVGTSTTFRSASN